ncbi:hydantoinase B/oxoprolinase family protein [Geobacter argillaceus]|uniref:N-methylhydantoinase B n=1 Tax=Geobacter argillaceus TaxID=345631 RepID=A0A562VPZ8_9BACT|nr:hydantoinase B/oxoprolinase family protein [Geobacter argillaceus]TWJ19861.1 N-methylhydantoinase B [Geobacter argillaceus]
MRTSELHKSSYEPEHEEKAPVKLDLITFEVLKNAFINLVDQMSEQLLRTCYSFVIYSRDFSNCICDRHGNTVAQGTQDIAVHVGTLHFSVKSVIEQFGSDIRPGDVFITNDPYNGGTHFNDVRIIRPIFCDEELVAFTQSNGHWADIGGSVPGSFDITAKEHFGEGLRITPMKIWKEGVFQEDVAKMLVSNMRAPNDSLGDLRAQSEATLCGARRLLALMDKYGKETILLAFEEVQNYVERYARGQLKKLPKGTWSATDFIDQDPSGEEGLIPIKVTMTIEEDRVFYDFTGTHASIGCFLNSTYSASFSGVVAGTKTFFPELPLNSGFYRIIDVHFPEGSVVNAPWPVAVAGYCSGSYEKIMNAIFALWSNIIPERALACSFNLEYLLVGGWDGRDKSNRRYFMNYDWMAGGWGGRNGRDGSNATSPVFGVGLAIQSVEAQERLSPVLTSEHQIETDSGGPGKYRGGCGVRRGGKLTKVEKAVMSYCCDRSRSVTWGIWGGLPSRPHGVSLLRQGAEQVEYLGAVFSNVPVKEGDLFSRPSSGGGGLGDPLERAPQAVLDDVIDGYVSVARARTDYGVVITAVTPELNDYRVDLDATARARADIRATRDALLTMDPLTVAEKFRAGEIDTLDVIRQYGVICNWNDRTLLPKTTSQFREALAARRKPPKL